jgi:GNAT superfamily N-acetyltransferase
MEIRELREDELPFLRDMLYAAVCWRPDGNYPPFEWAIAHPLLAMYHEGWGRPGDAGFVAEEDGRLVGAAWYRFFTEEVHGHGFVDEQTPELALAVAEGHRGRGLGRRLMEAIHERARGEGLGRMALSVEPDNYAKRLYESLGYVDYEPGDGHGRMLLDL